MKKVMYLVAALMVAATNVNAEEKVNQENAADFNINIRVSSLSRYLNLNAEQREIMESASEQFSYEVSCSRSKNPVKQSARLNKAVLRNIAFAHKVMTPDQYRTYLNVLNQTIVNKGLDKVLYYEDTAEK